MSLKRFKSGKRIFESSRRVVLIGVVGFGLFFSSFFLGYFRSRDCVFGVVEDIRLGY